MVLIAVTFGIWQIAQHAKKLMKKQKQNTKQYFEKIDTAVMKVIALSEIKD